MSSTRRQISFLLLLPALVCSFGGQHNGFFRSQPEPRRVVLSVVHHDEQGGGSNKSGNPVSSGEVFRDMNTSTKSRRQLLASTTWSLLTTGMTMILPTCLTKPCLAEVANENLDCLMDLPPIPEGCCRVYLCRHGQTENNRLRLVQGARVDAPINSNGEQMAHRMGMALSQVIPDKKEQTVLHSPLLRARQTAEGAASEFKSSSPRLRALDTLREVDFGPVAEGKQVSQVKGTMMRHYALWSLGFIDHRPKGGGETAREIFSRAAEAIKTMVQVAQENGTGEVVVVSHSTYIRMLLPMVLNTSLAEAGTNLKVVNGAINVIDFSTTKTTTLDSKSHLFGGPPFLARAPKKLSLSFPAGQVVRINEKRHLQGIL